MLIDNQETKELDNMSAISAENDRDFIGNDKHTCRGVARPEEIPMTSIGSGLDISSVSATMVLGYLLTLISGSVLLLTGQAPWFLLTVVVALAVALFLPG